MSKDLDKFLDSEDGRIAEFAINIRSASVKDYAERIELMVITNIGEALLPNEKTLEAFQRAFECHYGKEPTESIEEIMNWNEAKVHFSRGWTAKHANVAKILLEYMKDAMNES